MTNTDQQALLSLLRSTPDYTDGDGEPLDLLDLLPLVPALGDMGPIIYLYNLRREDTWTSSEELLRKVVNMAPNHSSRTIGEATVHNLRMLSAMAALMAGAYETHNREQCD